MTSRARVLMLGLAVLASAFSLQTPAFQVETFWPKPLPNHWILGSITGLAVDGHDHIWLVHRGLDSLNLRNEAGTGTNPPTAESCCAPAPPVLEFDDAGNLLSHWGGPGQGYDWPASPGGLAVEPNGTVWIAAAGPPDPLPAAGRTTNTGTQAGSSRAAAAPAKPADAHVLAFTPTGAFIRQIGKPGSPSGADNAALDRPADIAVDSGAGELYVADAGAHQRIVVLDSRTGAYKRQWTGHGSAFGRLTCVALSRDGRVYVCDRKSDRLQVFTRSGKFVNEVVLSKDTAGLGSVWDVTFSSDPAQRYVFVADGQNQRVHVLRRDTLQTVTSFGSGGRWPGAFYAVGSLGVDSKGNLYTGEAYEGKRIQKFVRKNAP